MYAMEGAMRAISVLLGMFLSTTVTAALADIVISKECDLLARGTRGNSDEVVVGAWCPDNQDWVLPNENQEATIEWSRQSRILQRVQSGEKVAIPDEHRCFSNLGVDPKAFPWFKPVHCRRPNAVSDAHLVRETPPSPPPEIVRKLISPPRFEDFTVRFVYKGKRARPRLTTDFARLFRTRLRNGAKEEPNFAGHYRLVFWGCGTNCLTGGVVNATTGAVTPVPRSLVFTGLCWNANVNRDYLL
jgi:hypothetical protein